MIKNYLTLALLVFVTSLYSQTTYVPDDNFEAYLEIKGWGDGISNNNFVDTNKIQEIKILRVSSKNISDLTGIEAFVNLEYLHCGSNQLTSLDVSRSTNLGFLDCSRNLLTNLNVNGLNSLTLIYCNENSLTSLDVSGLVSLTELDCFNNQLTSIDLGGITTLTKLGCSSNQLTNLDVSGLPSLTELGCSSNQLTNLNVNGLTALTVLSCNGNQLVNFDLSGLTALTKVNCNSNELTSLNLSGIVALDNLACSGNKLTSLNLSGFTSLTSLVCSANQLTNLDVSTQNSLTDLNCSFNQLTNLNISGLQSLSFIECSFNQLTSLDLSGLESLESLHCYDNSITSLDVSGIKTLVKLDCSFNQLTSLDLSGTETLSELQCSHNQLTSLDLSELALLYLIDCNDNNLSCLNLSNGNNSNFWQPAITRNDNLTCIKVDDVVYSTLNWSSIDLQTSFSAEPCPGCDDEEPLLSVFNTDKQLNEYELEIENLSIAADGSSSTVFKYTGSDKENISLLFKEQITSNPGVYGVFQEKEVSNDTTIIKFNHPKYFLEPNSEFPNPQHKKLTLLLKNDFTEEILFEYPIKIVRPSVLMVHGIWSNSIESFGSMQNYLESQGMYTKFQTLKVDYKNDQFNFESADDYIRYKKALKSDARRANISLGKFDVLAHSNGGLLSRFYIQGNDYKNDINKLITFNTPHSGSQLANLLLDPDFFILHPALEKHNMNSTNGVISDLKVDGSFIQNLNNLTPQQKTDFYGKIGVHTISSTETVDNIVGYWDAVLVYYLKFHWEEVIDLALENIVFKSPSHDIIVALDSQIGGSSSTSLVRGQMHSGSTSNPEILAKTVQLLNQNPDNPNYFSKFGISPPQLTTSFNSQKSNKSKTTSGDETMAILSPVEGAEFKTGQTVPIETNGSSGIENIVSTMGSGVVPFQLHITENASTDSFSLIIPENALGRLEIVSTGFSANGYEDFDSTFITVTTDAVLESVEIDQSLIYVPEGSQSVITIFGHYDDGEIRNITNIDDLVYSFEEQNAEITESGLVTGLNEGGDVLTVSYSGKSSTVPITIVSSIALSIEETNNEINAFVVFPNPTKDLLTIKFPANQIKAEVSIYTLLGQNVLSTEISSSNNDLNIESLQNGMYLVKIKTETSTITKRIIKQ